MKKEQLTDILNINGLITKLTKFVELKIEIYELKVKEQLVTIVANLASLILILSFGLFVIFFCSLALSFYLNSLFGSEFAGFICVGGFYFLICIFLIVFKDKLITNQLFESIFSDTLTDSDDESDSGQQE